MPDPVVSVITCVYNRASFINKCLNSIKSQTYSNIEQIIIDGFSDDGTIEKIQNYMKKNENKNIKLYQVPKKGIANALNEGFAKSTGQIIHYLHSDDYFLDNNAVERGINYFKTNPKTQWLTGNAVEDINGRLITLKFSKLLKLSLKVLSLGDFISHENTFVTRKFLNSYGPFSEKYKNACDYLVWLKAIKYIKPLVVDDSFAVFTFHKGSQTTNPKNLLNIAKEIIQCWVEAKSIPFIGHVG